MLRQIQFISAIPLLILALALAACSDPTPAAAPAEDSFGYQDLVEALESAGADVQPAGELEQDFFPVGAQIIRINAQDVQVFEFDSPGSMKASEATITGNGYIIGTMSIDWISAPYFFSRDRLIVLYVGTDESTLELLTQVLGPALTGPNAS
jgi:hypothetical protein